MVLPFLYVIGCAGTASMLARRRFEEVLPLALMGSAFALYLSGLVFGSLWPGYVVCVVFALLMPTGLLALAVRGHGGRWLQKQDGKNRHDENSPQAAQGALREILARIFTPAFAIFCVLGAVIFLLDWNKGFWMWDEYSHWGPMARETLRLDTLYTSPLARPFVHPDYPPIVCLFETLWCKLAGGYQEAYLYRGLHVLSFSLFFPALSRLRWKKSVGFALTCAGLLALLITVPLCVELEDGGFYSTIYLDCLLGLLLAYGVFLVLDAKRWGVFELTRLGVALSFLLLTKQMGIAFYALMIGVLVLDFCITRRACIHALCTRRGCVETHVRAEADTGKIGEKKRFVREVLNRAPHALWWRGAGAAGLLVAMPFLLSKLWSWHVAAAQLAQQFNLGGIRWAQLLSSVRGEGEFGWKQQVLSSYWEAIGSYRIVVWGKLHVPYWALILVFAALLLLVAWMGNRYTGKKLFAHGQAVACTVLLLGGGVAYALAMMLTYLTGFSEAESMRLASFPRYLGTYPFGIAALFGMVLLRALSAGSGAATANGGNAQTAEVCDSVQKKQGAMHWRMALAAWGAVVLLWVFCMPAEQAKQLVPTRTYSAASSALNEIVREVGARTPQGASVLVLSQNDAIADNALFYSTMLRYRMPERDTGFDYVDLKLPQEQYAMQAQVLANTLVEYNYLYLSNVDERCTQVYASLLDGAQAADRQIYQVEHGVNGALALTPVA